MAMCISRRLLRSFSSASSSTRLHFILNDFRYCLPSMDSLAFGKHKSFHPCQHMLASTLTDTADGKIPRHLLTSKPVPVLEVEIGLKQDKMCHVTNFQNEVTGTIILPGDVFDVPIRKDIVQRVVRWQLAKRQQGTHSTKTISEVRGTGKKPYQQKGTGRARHGTLRSNQFRGGATKHGPKPRSHAHKLNKKVRRLGLKIALSAYAAEGKLRVFDDLVVSSHKTKNIVNWANQMKNCKKFLLVDGTEIEEKLRLATQNLKYVHLLSSIGLNVYSILLHDTLIMTKTAVDMIVSRLRGEKPIKPQVPEADIKE